VATVRPHRGEVLDLRIEPKGRCADDEPGVTLGEFLDQPLDDLDGGVVVVGDAKEELKLGIRSSRPGCGRPGPFDDGSPRRG
jgi:hypothetical protein